MPPRGGNVGVFVCLCVGVRGGVELCCGTLQPRGESAWSASLPMRKGSGGGGGDVLQ